MTCLTCHMTCLTCHQVSAQHVSVRKTFLWRHRDMSRNFTTCRDIWWHVTTNVATCHQCRMPATWHGSCRDILVTFTCHGDMCNIAKDALFAAIRSGRFIILAFPLENVQVYVDDSKVTVSVKSAIYHKLGKEVSQSSIPGEEYCKHLLFWSWLSWGYWSCSSSLSTDVSCVAYQASFCFLW